MELTTYEILQTPCSRHSVVGCAKCKDAERQRKNRAAEKLVKETAASQDEINAIETIQDFWAISLRGLDPVKLAEWKTRQEEIFDTLHWMGTVMDGTYNVSPTDTQHYVGLEEGDEDIKRQLHEFGEVAITPVLWLGNFWTNPKLLAQLTKDEKPTAIFAKFGILVALPDLKVHQWEKFIAAHRRKTQPRVEAPQVFYTSVYCSMCSAPPIAISNEIAAAYARTKGYLCGNCLSKAAKLRDFTQEQRAPEHELFDGWGRVKT